MADDGSRNVHGRRPSAPPRPSQRRPHAFAPAGLVLGDVGAALLERLGRQALSLDQLLVCHPSVLRGRRPRQPARPLRRTRRRGRQPAARHRDSPCVPIDDSTTGLGLIEGACRPPHGRELVSRHADVADGDAGSIGRVYFHRARVAPKADTDETRTRPTCRRNLQEENRPERSDPNGPTRACRVIRRSPAPMDSSSF